MDGMTHHDCSDPEFLKQQESRLNKINVDEIYQYILDTIKVLNYGNNVVFLRQPSSEAINYFIENNVFFDLMSIDGSHDTKDVMSDINLYLPRLKDNGFLVMDDVSWESVKPVYNYVKNKMLLIYASEHFSIFQKSSNIIDELAVFFKKFKDF